MNEQEALICPWCHTEIVWDEDLGPEEQCPHCLNDLGDYRSVPLTGEDEEEIEAEAEEHVGPSVSDASGDELYTMSAYEAASRLLLDRQEVLADCIACGQEMIHIGQIATGTIVQQPVSLQEWNHPLLDGKLPLDAFICPTCFRVDTKLTDPARVQFVKQLTQRAE
ncbi:MAG: hypothetical protein K0R67_3110 [Paenibacillus sp.]|nr:hypothetical protein [Paenibacillus sp.]